MSDVVEEYEMKKTKWSKFNPGDTISIPGCYGLFVVVSRTRETVEARSRDGGHIVTCLFRNGEALIPKGCRESAEDRARKEVEDGIGE